MQTSFRMNDMKRFIFVFALLSQLVSAWPAHAVTNGPLTRNPQNPNYFFDRSGRPVYLTGSHNWNVFYDTNHLADVSNHAFFNILSGNGHNFMRFWMDDLFASLEGGYQHIDPSIERYKRSAVCCASDGGAKFDLTQFNPAHYQHLRDIALELQKRGIYMSIMFTNGWWVKSGDAVFWENAIWPYNYFHPGNAIQDTAGTTKDNVYSVSSPVTPFFKAHIAKVIDTVKDLDNVFFEIMNEAPSGNMDWQQQMLDYVRTLDTVHPVGITTDIACGMPVNNYQNTADWISPCGTNLKTDMPAQNSNKVVLLDTDHIWGEGGDDDWVLRALTRGYNPIYMDNLLNAPEALRARKAMGVTNYLANTRTQNLVNMRPNVEPCSTAFCMSNGVELIAYFPAGGASVNLGADWQYEWYGTQSTVTLGTSGLAPAGASVLFASKIAAAATATMTPQATPTGTLMPSPSPLPTVTQQPAKTVTLVVYGSAVNEDGSNYIADPNTFWIGTGATTSHTGIRFPSVTIPQGATINHARLEGSPASNIWSNLVYNLHAENSDNSPPFSSASRPSSRAPSANFTAFAEDSNWLMGNYYDLGAVDRLVQGIVNRAGWASGNALSFIARGNTPWSRKHLMNSGANPPRLTVTYTTDGSSEPAVAPAVQFDAAIFNNKTLAGTPALTRTDTGINFNWGSSSPQSGIVNANNFSVRWSASAPFAAGAYTFSVTGNDGYRLYIDGVRVINKWSNRASASTTSVRQSLAAGAHNIVLEYYDNTGNAQISLTWR